MRTAPLPPGFKMLPQHIKPIPPHLLEVVGQVIVHWCELEVSLNVLIEAMSELDGGELEENWLRRNFRKRLELYKLFTKSTFRDTPAAFNLMRWVSSTAKPLALRRNLICHGHLVVHFKPGEVGIKVSGRHNGEVRTIYENAKSLNELNSLICEVSGIAAVISEGVPPYLDLDLPLPDKERLRELAQKARPISPKHRMS